MSTAFQSLKPLEERVLPAAVEENVVSSVRLASDAKALRIPKDFSLPSLKIPKPSDYLRLASDKETAALELFKDAKIADVKADLFNSPEIKWWSTNFEKAFDMNKLIDSIATTAVVDGNIACDDYFIDALIALLVTFKLDKRTQKFAKRLEESLLKFSAKFYAVNSLNAIGERLELKLVDVWLNSSSKRLAYPLLKSWYDSHPDVEKPTRDFILYSALKNQGLNDLGIGRMAIDELNDPSTKEIASNMIFMCLMSKLTTPVPHKTDLDMHSMAKNNVEGLLEYAETINLDIDVFVLPTLRRFLSDEDILSKCDSFSLMSLLIQQKLNAPLQ
ncbi:hypothetical protein Plhal304r1_c019g0067211 [Plasmopara halstedii]